MYLNHFGLEQYPFTLTPDTEFFVDYGEFRDALDVLECALFTGEGFTKVTGEVGTGKTLLCRKLLHSLDQSYVTVYIANPSVTPKALLIVLAKKLGIGYGHKIGQARLLENISDRLLSMQVEGKRVVLLIDEAQSLPDNTMEALRLFSNLETEKSKLLQLVLFGQPELDTRLQQDHFRQLRQRIVFSHKLKPLSPDALAVYVQHRLHVAGHQTEPLFNARALRLLQQGSGGVPRIVNILAHKAMLVAFGRGDTVIDAIHVRKAIADTDGVRTNRQRTMRTAALCGLRRPAAASV